MRSIPTAHCFRCRTDVAPVAGRCPWCDYPLEQRERRTSAPAPRARRKRRRCDAKLNADQVDAAWKVYEAGHSVRWIAHRIWRQWGFASANSCKTALYDAFAAEGYRLRERIAATRAASTTHGLRPRRGQTEAERRAYNDLRNARRNHRPQCRGIKAHPPQKGRRCKRKALADSEYCFNHDPRNHDAIVTHLADLRARIGKHDVGEDLAAAA